MAHEAAEVTMGLPTQVVTPVDLGRLIRELESTDEAMLQLKIRQGGDETKLPAIGMLLDKTVQLNKVNLLQETERTNLKSFLSDVKQKAPVMHMSFSADPSSLFLERIVEWIRKEIHPLAIISVGLQPNIGAGCVLRTTNQQFDMSLREDFKLKRELLMEKMREHGITADASPESKVDKPAPTENQEVLVA